MAYERLQAEGKIGTMTVKNRVVMVGIGMMTGDPGGRPGAREKEYFKARADGGAGLIITAVTRINDRDGAVAPTQLSMSDDRYIEPMSQMVKEIHAHGSKLVVQLQHPGRQNFASFANMAPMMIRLGEKHPKSWKTMLKLLGSADTDAMCKPPMSTMARLFLKPNLAPSSVPLAFGDTAIRNQPTKALTIEQIKRLENEFAQAALRVKKSGADGVEFHAAHGYLISEFFSPHTNRRKDAYGGSLENRCRFLREILEQTRALVGKDFPIIVRLNVDEFYRDIDMPGVGLEMKEGIEIARLVERYGADAIDVSCGTYETLNHLMEVTTYPLGWRTYLAAEVKKAVQIPVISVGMIRTPEQAEQLLEDDCMDFIGLGRPLVADPNWMKKTMEGRSEDIVRCIACQSCKMTQYKNAPGGETGRCAMNPRACHEYEFPETGEKNGIGKTVVIIGAGPGGLTAARELALREFRVVVLEKASCAGGQLNLADKPPMKEKYAWAAVDLLRAANQAGAEVLFQTEATEELVMSYAPYAVIDASGGTPFTPSIPGVELPNVVQAAEILSGSVSVSNQNILLIGSGVTGLETAHMLVEVGNKVSIFEMSGSIAPGAWPQQVNDLVPKLKKQGVEFHMNQRLAAIASDGITTESTKRKNRVETHHGDLVVLSLGVRPNPELFNRLKSRCERVYQIGDAVKGGYIIDSTLAAFNLARAL